MMVAGVLCFLVAIFGSMTGGMSSRYHDYQSALLTAYGAVLTCYVPAFIIMVIWLRIGIVVLWCLIAAGGVLFCVSGFKSGAMLVSGYSIVIPLIGKYVLGLREERSK
jgi:hypothetical protein